MIRFLQHQVTCVGIQISYQLNCGFITNVRIDINIASTWLHSTSTIPLIICNDKTESKFTQEQHYLHPSQIPQT